MLFLKYIFKALAKNFQNNKWNIYNDNIVEEIESPIEYLQDQANRHPYILIFSKVNNIESNADTLETMSESEGLNNFILKHLHPNFLIVIKMILELIDFSHMSLEIQTKINDANDCKKMDITLKSICEIFIMLNYLIFLTQIFFTKKAKSILLKVLIF